MDYNDLCSHLLIKCKHKYTSEGIITDNNTQSKVKESKGKESKVNERKYIEKGFLEIFNRWLKYKKDKKQTYKNEDSIEMAYNKLYKLSGGIPKVATEIVEQSLAANWAGLFPLKEDAGKKSFNRHVENSNDFSNQYPSVKK